MKLRKIPNPLRCALPMVWAFLATPQLAAEVDFTPPPANQPPTISNIPDQTVNENGTTGPLAFTVSDIETPASSLILSATSTDTKLVPLNNIVLGVSPAGRSVTVTPASNQVGTTVIKVTVTDANKATASDTFQVTVTECFSVPLTLISAVLDCQSNKVTVTFSAPLDPKSAETPANYQIFFPGAAPLVIGRVQLLAEGRTVCIFLSPDPPLNAAITYTLRVRNVRDACGISISENSQLTISCLPDECITIRCPESIVVDCQSLAGTPVNFVVQATNRCSRTNLTLKCEPPPNSLFPRGNTVVNCTAAGNNQTARCNFTVTVLDRTPPVLECPGDQVVETTSPQGTQVFYNVTAADNCDTNLFLECVPPSGSSFPLGTTTVVCNARDSSQNFSRCTFQVTVVRQPCAGSSKGSEFWLTFPGNYPDPINPLELSLCIVGPSGTSGTVDIADPPFSAPFTIPLGAMSTTIMLPTSAGLAGLNDATLKNGIHVTANSPVAVFGFSHLSHSTEAYLGLPTGMLGTEYVLMTYGNLQTGVPELNGTQFALVACTDNTKVQITVPVGTGSHQAGIPFTITLNSGQTYQLRNTGNAPVDLTGTVIQADKPLAVFGSQACANIPSNDRWFCDYVVEQLLPTSNAGASFITMPVATRVGGDTFRFLAINNGTTVSIDGVPLPLLNRAQFHERQISNPAQITANAPIFVAQYAHSSDLDGIVNSDPFMVLLPHKGLFSTEHMVCVAGNEFTKNFINVVIPTASTGSVRLDGAIPPAAFAEIGASGYSGAQIAVSPGPHNVTASAPFGTIVYGFAEFDSYGYPGSFLIRDSTPPTLTCPVTNATVQLPVSTLGNCLAVVPDFRRDSRVTDDCGLPQELVITQSPAPDTSVGPGVHTVTLSVADAAGNIGSCQITLTVIDPTPIILTCPSNIVVTCSTTGTGTIVNYSVSARSQCQTNVPVVCVPPSGSSFPVGTTPVVCQATGANGQTSTCTFFVNVTCAAIRLTIADRTVNLTFPTKKGSRHVLGFKNALTESNWTVLRVIEGTDSEASFNEPAKPMGSRFYRVREQ